ncbi:MAG TPA: acetyl-CoA hydrolase/transferase C-terminal domain-containing protein, partial [Syntrophomonas sp.]|nr:acetyl-CoA hydrolase/transferase C-terminal domain-containing protein [Syntrophomonas sp.]
MNQKWRQMYAEKLKTPEEAVKLVADGDKISFPTINGTPRFLSKALAERVMKDEVKDLELIVGLNLNATDLLKPEVLSRVHYCGGYLSPFERQVSDQMDLLVWRFADDARLMYEVRGTNVCFMTVAPMDEHGYFSAALNCSHTYSMFQKLKANGKPVKVFLEVNKNAPTCYGFNHFHISEVTALIEADWDLIEIPSEEPNEKDIAIGSYVAEMIPDGATVQLGIGGIPNAVGKQLVHKKDLGCHSEMIVEAYLELYKCGALNNSKKNYMPDRFVATLLAGSKELYQWVDHNPAVCIYGIDECATPEFVARNDNFISINSTMECDLSGQCISETKGIIPYSGMGGQADFVQGAWQSKGGKAFLCMYSSYTDGKGELRSKISPVVNGWISISRNDVQYIVTEYGCVYLKGKTMQERVKLITSVAHPDFREWLVYEAKRLGIIQSISDVNLK